MNRNLLYNPNLTEEESVVLMLGIPMTDGLSKGMCLSIEEDNSLFDIDLGLPVAQGLYIIDSIEDNILEITEYKTTNNYSIYEEDTEPLLETGVVVIQENVESFTSNLFEDGKPGQSGLPKGYMGAVKAVNPPAYNAMTNTLFKKGYLQKFRNDKGATTVKYKKRAFPSYASGNPNPEYKTNQRRARRRRWRDRHNA